MPLVFAGEIGSTHRVALVLLLTAAALSITSGQLLAHNVTPGDAGYVQEIWGVHLIPYTYLGAKHMITGYDKRRFLPLQDEGCGHLCQSVCHRSLNDNACRGLLRLERQCLHH